jgi:Flp pilus assembly protein TadD
VAADWDWELAAVTLVPVLCAVGLVRSAAEDGGSRWSMRLARPARLAGSLAVLVTGAFVLITLLGNSALSASTTALQDGNVREAESQARSAMTWAPWSGEPWRRLGEAQYRGGQLALARTSFARAVQKEPNDWTLWLDLALVSHGAGRRDALVHATMLNPDDARIHKLVLETRA